MMLVPARGVPASLPAPTGGWNARDVLGEMQPNDAVALVNFFPGTTSVMQRLGYSRWATGIAGQVETLFSYASGTSRKLFAVAGGSIYDCTALGAVGAAAVTALTNSRFQYVNMTTPGGSYLLAVNGADKMRNFDGTTWRKDGDGAPYDVTVGDSSTFVSINIHKFRNGGQMV